MTEEDIQQIKLILQAKAQNLRDKPVSIAILSLSYFLLSLIAWGTAAVLK